MSVPQEGVAVKVQPPVGWTEGHRHLVAEPYEYTTGHPLSLDALGGNFVRENFVRYWSLQMIDAERWGYWP